jgi:hypothetical protein
MQEDKEKVWIRYIDFLEFICTKSKPLVDDEVPDWIR